MQPSNPTSMTVEAPGRINLIGEHIDYNGGSVLPAAIDKRIRIRFIKNKQSYCSIRSNLANKPERIDLQKLHKGTINWLNYIIGVLYKLDQYQPGKIGGFDAHIESDLPIGAGISSSAALECGFAVGVNALFDLGIPKMQLIQLCMEAEHEFAGTKCGIMDQFSVMMGVQNQLILLDCSSLQHSMIEANVAPYQLLLLNSNVHHQLADSAYNKRRASCERVLNSIRLQHPEYTTLCAVPMPVLEQHQQQLNDEDYRRACFVLQENARTHAVVEHLNKQDIKSVGACLFESHRGLSQQYEVSCAELDFMVDFAHQHEGVIGARMMGGGFGGCSINLVHPKHKEAFVESLSKAYGNQFNLTISPIDIAISKGVNIVQYG